MHAPKKHPSNKDRVHRGRDQAPHTHDVHHSSHTTSSCTMHHASSSLPPHSLHSTARSTARPATIQTGSSSHPLPFPPSFCIFFSHPPQPSMHTFFCARLPPKAFFDFFFCPFSLAFPCERAINICFARITRTPSLSPLPDAAPHDTHFQHSSSTLSTPQPPCSPDTKQERDSALDPPLSSRTPPPLHPSYGSLFWQDRQRDRPLSLPRYLFVLFLLSSSTGWRRAPTFWPRAPRQPALFGQWAALSQREQQHAEIPPYAVFEEARDTAGEAAAAAAAF